ncbi:SCO2102 family sporulation regulator [Streptomyces sp. NPDC002306]
MGWTVLYIAFGIVALWLLGEVLLQYKARLRWRLLAFGGFLLVVVGVLIPSVIVIGLGAAAFAVGQTYVTLSFRRGFAAGWAVSRPDADAEGAGNKRRRGRADRHDPALEVSDLEPAEGGYADEDRDEGRYAEDRPAYRQDEEYDRDDVFTPGHQGDPAAAETTSVYEPQPLPDDTGSYGVYGDNSFAAGTADPSYAATGQPQDQYATAAQGADQTYGYDGYSGYQQQYGYDTTGQQQYAAYSDPYIGTQTYGGGSYDAGYDGQYTQQGYGQDQYGNATYGGETPAGGVWVPQQRSDDSYGGELPPEQQYPYQGDGQQQGNGGGNGFDEQYRF